MCEFVPFLATEGFSFFAADGLMREFLPSFEGTLREAMTSLRLVAFFMFGRKRRLGMFTEYYRITPHYGMMLFGAEGIGPRSCKCDVDSDSGLYRPLLFSLSR